MALTKFGFLPSSGASNKKELLLAREILEIGAQWSVRVGDADAFERYARHMNPPHKSATARRVVGAIILHSGCWLAFDVLPPPPV